MHLRSLNNYCSSTNVIYVGKFKFEISLEITFWMMKHKRRLINSTSSIFVFIANATENANVYIYPPKNIIFC